MAQISDSTPVRGLAFGPTVRRWGRAVLDALYPPLCLACRAAVSESGSLCPDCWRGITFFDGPVCACCGMPFDVDPQAETMCGACYAKPPSFDAARSVMRYDDASRGALIAFKRADRLDMAPAFVRWLERTGTALLDEADIIVPVPLHPIRLWARRFNQAALLARLLSRGAGKPFVPLALVRIRSTPSQGAMTSAKARRRNVRGAFKVRQPDAVAGRTVLLVDDVLTTGATVEACARALKRAGAAKVLVLTLARVVRPLTGAI